MSNVSNGSSALARLTENVFKRISATLTIILTLKHKNLFGKTEWHCFSGNCPSNAVALC